MTRHSTLTNQDDLHYAKLRSFTGDISLISPDFVDQIFASTDTNRIYRSSGVGLGDLIELLPTPLPPVSVANEWIPLSPDDSLQVGKSYISNSTNEMFVKLPLGAVSGQSINLFTLEGSLLLNSQGINIVRLSNTTPSPFNSSGTIVALRIKREIMAQLTFDSSQNGRWILIQGELEIVFYLRNGCIDPTAINYDPIANVDDGSCIFPLYGCTDPLADNYDPLANTDDGSCIFS